jgi:hypothetical protein
MLSKARITVDHVSLPKNWRQVLRRTPYRRHCKRLFFFIVGVVKVILALSKVNYFDLVIGHDEQVSWLEVPVANPFALKERTGGYKAAIHCYKFSLSPEEVRLFSFSIERLQISVFIHELGDDANFESIVSGLAQEISVILDDIGMILNFPKLLCFFFKLIEFVECFGFYFFEGIKLASGYMKCLIYLSVFFAGAEHF